VTEEELEEIIEKARIDQSEILDLRFNKLVSLPESIGNLSNLRELDLRANDLIKLPESIGNLSSLIEIDLRFNKLVSLPESICNLFRLTTLNLHCNQLAKLPESIGKLCNLTALSTEENNLTRLPESISTLSNLTSLNLHFNQLTSLPESIVNLSNLREIYLSDNPWNDASLVLFELQLFPNLITASFFDIDSLPRRYWTNFDEWNPKWLLDEENAEIRQVLIQQIGYDRICQELDAIDLNTWREYTLLKIDADIDEEPMVLLKMTCPSTGHIHILRVPPEMTSAEAAITWVNHGIHPDEFTVET
jgi:leucine-rich repeat protein SHOC2